MLSHVSLNLCGVPRLTINWSSDFTQFYNQNGQPLSQGVPNMNQDGAVVQLGYFSDATAQNLFAGEWIPLTLNTSIGDSQDLTGFGNGYFSFTSYFVSGSQFVPIYPSNTIGTYQTQSAIRLSHSTPLPGQYLAIRFHNGNWQEMDRYNTIASPIWQWGQLSELSFFVLGIFVEDLFPSEIHFEDPANPYKTSLLLQNAWDYGRRLEGNDWYELFWFGYYNQSSNDWIYHIDYGWLYPDGETPGSVWFYHSELGWMWTNPQAYPWLYSKEDEDWLYFRKYDLRSWIYHYKDETWQRLPEY